MGFPDQENGDPFQVKTSRSASPGGRKTAGMVSGRGILSLIPPLSHRYCKGSPHDASLLPEKLPGHGNSLLKAGPFEFLNNGFENRRYVDMLRAFVNALPALNAQGRKLGLPEGDSAAQPCSVHEFFINGIFDHGEVVVFLETQRPDGFVTSLETVAAFFVPP